jgi:hypothetical protein
MQILPFEQEKAEKRFELEECIPLDIGAGTSRVRRSVFWCGGGMEKKKKLSACRGEGSAVGLQLRVRFVPAALLAMLRTALALQCVSKARDWTGHVDR